jgi:hypothetical protein
MPNLLHRAEGKIMEAYRKEMPCSEPAERAVKARVTFMVPNATGDFRLLDLFR